MSIENLTDESLKLYHFAPNAIWILQTLKGNDGIGWNKLYEKVKELKHTIEPTSHYLSKTTFSKTIKILLATKLINRRKNPKHNQGYFFTIQTGESSIVTLLALLYTTALDEKRLEYEKLKHLLDL